MASKMVLSVQLNVTSVSHTSWRKVYRAVNQTSPEIFAHLISLIIWLIVVPSINSPCTYSVHFTCCISPSTSQPSLLSLNSFISQLMLRFQFCTFSILWFCFHVVLLSVSSRIRSCTFHLLHIFSGPSTVLTLPPSTLIHSWSFIKIQSYAR